MTRNQPKEQRIEQILQAAVSEFLDKGYEGASMDSIARRAGLTKGGVYHHFRNKDDILRAANDLFQEPIEQLAAQCSENPYAVDALHAFINGYISHWASHPREIAFVFLSMSKMLAIPQLWPMMEEYYEQAITYYQILLEKAVTQGSLKSHDTKGRALALVSAMDGITPYLVARNTTVDITAVARQLEDALLTDIRIDSIQSGHQ